MTSKVSMRNLAALGVSAALLMTLAVPRLAFAIASQTVLCEGEVVQSNDSTVPTGEVFSLGTVTVSSATKHCVTTTATVTQVTQAQSGPTPLIRTLTETNSVPQDTTGCSATNNIPGTTVSTITASSNADLIGCQETSIANTVASSSGAYTMTITPVEPGAATCKVASTGNALLVSALRACVSNSQ